MKNLLVYLLLFFSIPLFAQQSYIPLQTGNAYAYDTEYWSHNPGSHSFFTTVHRITKDSIINGKKYYYFTLFSGWVRYDSTLKNLVIYSPSTSCGNYTGERVLDSLNANVNDSIKFCSGGLSKKCTSKQPVTYYFNTSLNSIGFNSGNSSSYGNIQYCEGIGVTYFASGYQNSYTSTSIIKGCIVNGVPYGNISPLMITQLSSDVPDNYSLTQNYPNPFNPSTRINYELKISNYVTLKVFDLLGKEVASLVNEKQTAGSYAVDFNSAEYNIPSGIYFYTLNAGEFKETRKMLLIK